MFCRAPLDAGLFIVVWFMIHTIHKRKRKAAMFYLCYAAAEVYESARDAVTEMESSAASAAATNPVSIKHRPPLN
ncbi:hypothetical protein EYF80_059261 [Liparis tanakae]|uniref:Uncharacterized protein n=1 Tax=Liparis tanakae TaxID=230148 RepID=A0A4Z2ENS3_9TELE|nr:hypothetical protein EYF80_059261 [Liparis tanakae]